MTVEGEFLAFNSLVDGGQDSVSVHVWLSAGLGFNACVPCPFPAIQGLELASNVPSPAEYITSPWPNI